MSENLELWILYEEEWDAEDDEISESVMELLSVGVSFAEAEAIETEAVSTLSGSGGSFTWYDPNRDYEAKRLASIYMHDEDFVELLITVLPILLR